MRIRRQLEPYEESVVLHIQRDTIILINCKPPVDMRQISDKVGNSVAYQRGAYS